MTNSVETALHGSNPFLTGIHTPMLSELTLTDLLVTGVIPPELNGRYIRIGPNPAAAPDPGKYHWFSGDGMVHGVCLRGGKALWYRNRWIKSTAVASALDLPQTPGPRNGRNDNVNTNVLGHGGETWAINEGGAFPVRIDEELNTVAYDPFGGTLKGSFTAHPHLDADTGEMHAICYEPTDPDTIRHVVIDATGKVRRDEPVSVEHGPSIHDCMITKNYVIIFDLPVTFSMKALQAGYAFPYAWNPAHKARIGLLPREGRNKDLIWCAVSPCYIFHASNAYEDDDGKVVLDACVYETMFEEGAQGPDSKAGFERLTMDPVSRSVTRVVIDPDSQEFPRPNETLLGMPYRYAYTIAVPDGFDAPTRNQSKLYKHDLQAGTRMVHDLGANHIPGEFVFVPRAGGGAEDSGWLMGYVVDVDAESASLVIVDAARFDSEPQAVIRIPHRIPPGFHGNWVPD